MPTRPEPAFDRPAAATGPPARPWDIVLHTMAEHGLDRAQAIRKIVEDRQREASARSYWRAPNG